MTYTTDQTEKTVKYHSKIRSRDNLTDVYRNKPLIYKGVKRFGDIVLSLTALICLSPLLLITAIAITLEDGGSPFLHRNAWGKI